MQWYPQPFSRDETRLWIERNQRALLEDGFALWALELRSSRELIGDCGLTKQRVDGDDEIEVGWHVRRELWGRGLATEAARAVIRHAFEDLSIPRLISLVRPENVASWRVAERLGMHVEKETMRGAFRHRVYRLERPLDVAG